MGTAAPVIVAEMDDWVALGGGNSGIVGNADHTFGFHVAADELPATDYSRTRDPNGANGPYVDWSYACAGDFRHGGNETLRAMHRDVLARLMRGELPMICEWIGQPWADQPVYYWARWNGVGTLQRYTGAGHDLWSHISWYRSMVDQPAHLWTPSTPSAKDGDNMALVVKNTDGTYWVLGGDGVPRRLALKSAEGIEDFGWVVSGRWGSADSTPRPGWLPVYNNPVIDSAPWIDIPTVPVAVIDVVPDTPPASVDAAAVAKALAPLLSSSGELPAVVVDALGKLGDAADAVVAAARGE